MSTSCSSNNDYSNYKKPYFTIEFTAKRLGAEIRLNDIPVFKVKNSGFMTLEIQANEYITNGNNEIKVITFPLFDDNKQDDDYINDTAIEVGLYVREDDESTEKKKLVSKVLIKPNNAYIESTQEPIAVYTDEIDQKRTDISIEKDGTILDYPYYGVYKKQVVTKWVIEDIKSSLPHWQWQDGKIINNNDDTYQSLLKAYTIIHDAFAKKDLTALKQASLPRSKELAAAYYLGDAEAGFDYSALGKYIDHPAIKLYDELALNHAKLEVFADGKLARITNGAGTHPVLFINDDTGQLYQDQFMWQKNKNNEWVLIR